MNRLYPHPIIAREGWPFIGGGLVFSPYLPCNFSVTPPAKFRKIPKRF